MKRYNAAVVPGSFDPVTIGHLDLIRRAAAMFETVYAAVFCNADKSGMFTPEEKLHMLRLAVSDLPNVICSVETGVLADFAVKHDAVIVKGVRNASDFDYEMNLACINRAIAASEAADNAAADSCETVLLPAKQEYLHISSSYVREMLRYNGNYRNAVPDAVYRYLSEEWKK